MAQIKNIKKPGEQIRGADVGLAGLDKNGNVVGTGITENDLFVLPEGAQSGDVLAWGGESGAEWKPHYPDGGSEGDVLTKGETGPEWATPGGSKLYLHIISYSPTGTYISRVYIHILTKSSDYILGSATASIDNLYTWLNTRGFNSKLKAYPVVGANAQSTKIIFGVYAGGTDQVWYTYITPSDTTDIQSSHDRTNVTEDVVEVD